MEQMMLTVLEKAGLPAVIIIGGGIVLIKWAEKIGEFASELGKRLIAATESNAQSAQSTTVKLDNLTGQLDDYYKELLDKLDKAEKSNADARDEVHAVRTLLEQWIASKHK